MRLSGSSTTVGLIRTMTLAITVTGIAACGLGGITDFTDNSNCELIFTTAAQGSNPTTAIKVINRLDGGLAVGVGSSGPGQPIVSVGADMNPNTCELYGLFPGLYEVTLRQCNQDEPGSSECSSEFGPQVERQIDLSEGATETVEVTSAFF